MRKVLLLLSAMFLLQATPAIAQYEEGFEYQKIKQAMPTVDSSKVEVIEFFWYGCPHCYHFEPVLNKWLAKKPDDVVFLRVPAIFRENFIPHAQAYYSAEYLKVTDKIHHAIFKAYHDDKNKLTSKTAISKLFVDNGVKKADFENAWNSFVVQSKLKRAIGMTSRYGIKSVPTMVVNGKYQTNATIATLNKPTASGHETAIEVVNWLVKRERALMKNTVKK